MIIYGPQRHTGVAQSWATQTLLLVFMEAMNYGSLVARIQNSGHKTEPTSLDLNNQTAKMIFFLGCEN